MTGLLKISPVLLAVVALAGLAGCKDDPKPKPSASATSFSVSLDAADYVKVGFGGDRAHGGAWDEVSVQGDGAVRWTHVDAREAQTTAGFDKRGTLPPDNVGAWFQSVVDDGLFELEASEVPKEGMRMTVDANIDGKTLKIIRAGAPDGKLQVHLDQATAVTLETP